MSIEVAKPRGLPHSEKERGSNTALNHRELLRLPFDTALRLQRSSEPVGDFVAIMAVKADGLALPRASAHLRSLGTIIDGCVVVRRRQCCAEILRDQIEA